MPKSNRGNTNQMQDDYKVKVIDRRSRYDKDVEEIIKKEGLSDEELKLALTSLRKDFVQDLQRLAKETITDAINKLVSKQNRNSSEDSGSDKTSAIANISKNILSSGKEMKDGLSVFGQSIKVGFDGTKDNTNKLLTSLATKADTKLSGIFGSGPGGGIGGAGVLQILWKIYQVAGQIASITNNLFSDSINQAIQNQQDLMGAVNGRLYGLNAQLANGKVDDYNYYGKIVKDFGKSFMNNSFVLQTNLWNNIKSLVQGGIGFNLEERAYIEELAKKTVTTFNVTNADLLRNIRLNQFDLTQAQFGAEGLLTKFLNANYQDSSYLSDQYQAVYGAISDALSQMNYGDATAFNFAVQKWLGSLYSVGASGNLISQLASGLNMLATGDIGGLEGNQSLQNMFVMAATKAGLSYSELLTNGLDADKVDTLMSSMVTYLQDIANNTSNEVVKNAWKGIVGVGVSDLRAIQNLNNVSYIAGVDAGFESAMKEAQHQADLYEGENRVSVAERISNQMNNLLYSVGANLVNNAGLYEEYRKSQLVESLLNSMSGSLGFIGELAEDIMTPILAIMQSHAIEEAFSDVMQEAGYGTTIETNVEAVEQDGSFINTQTGESIDTYDFLNKGNATKSTVYEFLQYMKQSDAAGSRYKIADAQKALDDAYEKGFVIVPYDEATMKPESGQVVDQDLSWLYTADYAEALGQAAAYDESTVVPNIYHQSGASWAWKKVNGGQITKDEIAALEGGMLASPSQLGMSAVDAGQDIDLDTTLAADATQRAHYGLLAILNQLITAGWDPIDNGMGLTPFGDTTGFTVRGNSLYGLNSNGTTSNTVSNLLASSVAGQVNNPSGIIQTTANTLGTVASNVSSSYELINNTEEAFTTLSRNEQQVQATTRTVSSVQEETSKTLDELYTALFIDGKSVNVSVQSVSETVATALQIAVENGTIPVIDRLDAGVDVKVDSNSATNYFDTVANMKGW